MSIDKMLEKMDQETLMSVIAKANALVVEKGKEQLKLIWIVSDNYTNLGWFKENEYIKAAEFLLGEAKDITQDTDNPQLMRLNLEFIRVPESEYGDWFSL